MSEKGELARDLYLYAAKNDGYGNILKIFLIMQKQGIAEAIRVLLEKYNINDSSTGAHNTYTDTELQNLYDSLLNIAVGSDDIATLRVGSLVEETDIIAPMIIYCVVLEITYAHLWHKLSQSLVQLMSPKCLL